MMAHRSVPVRMPTTRLRPPRRLLAAGVFGIMPLLLLSPVVLGSSTTEPHYHNGKLDKYENGPPSLLLTSKESEELAEGKAIMQVVVNPVTNTRRLMMVRDIAAPSWVVLDRIMDLDNYPKMVQGVDRLERYAEVDLPDGTQEIRAKYDIHALHMKFTYFMLHKYDPKQRCLTFHLDYNRQSDLDDSVGYWYVLPQSNEACRVYYSCDTKLRGWVPGPVYALLGKTALRQATTWVHAEAIKQWASVRSPRGRSPLSKLREGPGRLAARMRQGMQRSPDADGIGSWLSKRRQAAEKFIRPRSISLSKKAKQAEPTHFVKSQPTHFMHCTTPRPFTRLAMPAAHRQCKAVSATAV